MKLNRTLALISLCLSLSADAGYAAGVNLSWNACTAEGGVQNKSFACNTNAGSHVLYGSFILDASTTNTIGLEAKVDIAALADSLPYWWRFAAPNSCRFGLASSFSFSTDPNAQ